jgi:hypothetical protein
MTSIVQPGMDWVGSRSRRACILLRYGVGTIAEEGDRVALLGERSGAEDEREE